MVEGDLYYDATDSYVDGCIWPHRWRVNWCNKIIAREPLPERLRMTLDKTAKTFFRVSALHEFLVAIGKEQEPPHPCPLKVVLDQVLKLSSTEFEDLIADLLLAIGLKEVELMPPNFLAVDIVGVLDTAGLVNTKMFVQAKHHRYGKVSPKVVTALRGALPEGGGGVIVTTSDFNKSARNAANKPGFKSIALINGRQMARLLIEHWEADSLTHGEGEVASWHERLALTTGLVHR